MPFQLVLTKNFNNEEVCAVPEGWVVGTHLYWPRSLKKNDIESLRSNENSIPDKSWKKMKCRVKCRDIGSFKEALHLEDLYSKFQDTEDEEMYLIEQKNKKQTTDLLSKELLDVNAEFDENIICSEVNIDKNNTKSVENSIQELSSDNQNGIQNIFNDVQDTSTSKDDICTITTSELYKIIQENNSLRIENTGLKEELLRSVEFQNETKKNFAIMQTQLDKVIDLLQNKSQASISSITDSTGEDGINNIIIGNLKFPIETKEQLDALEYELLKKDIMTFLVKKFSETCGTSGVAKFSKIGLPLIKRFIKDELLNQFTWKGIKGSTKMAFVQYVKIRELFYKVAHLADKTCSFSDSDLFLQNSAIKHSGQRIKRHILSSESKMNVKRTKKEINIIEKDSSKMMIPDAEMVDSVITEDKDKENTDGSNDNQINEENSYITKNNHRSETSKKSTDGGIRDIDMNEMNDKKCDSEKHHGLKYNKEGTDENRTDVNDENIDSSTQKKETDDVKNTKKITLLSEVKVTNKEVDIKNVKIMANISSINASTIFDDLMRFSP